MIALISAWAALIFLVWFLPGVANKPGTFPEDR